MSDEPAPAAGGEMPFSERLRGVFEERRADGRGLALLLVDCGIIDRIDTLWGYHIGDAVRSRIVASLRSEVLRPSDFVGELGRDEIACALDGVESAQIALLAAEKSLRTLNAPLWLGEEEVYPTVSIGVAAYFAGEGSADALLQQAKSACISAAGLAGHIALYDGAVNAGAARLVEEARLRTAVAEDALELVFQPQFDLRFGQIMGMEALLRSRDGARGLVAMQDAFVAAAAAGVVPKLISSVLNRALRNCSEFRQRAGLDLRVAIDLPARVLLQSELPEMVERALRTWALRPGRLVLEIQDVSLLETNAAAEAAVKRLREIGVKLSIDDVRMPLTALFRLATLPFQELKIDVSNAHAWSAEQRSERVLRSLVELARHLGLEVTALAAQDDAQAAKLAEMGCDYLQAEFKGPPVDPEDFVGRFAG